MYNYNKDIIAGACVVAVIAVTSVVMPLCGVFVVSDIGNYLSGIGNILLSVIAFFSFLIAFRSYIAERNDIRKQRNETLYSKYTDLITKIFDNLAAARSTLFYSRKSYDEFGRLVELETHGKDVLHVLSCEFEMLLSAINSEDYECLTQAKAEQLSANIEQFYKEMMDQNLQEEQQPCLNKNVRNARGKIACMHYNLTTEAWHQSKSLADEDKHRFASESFAANTETVLAPYVNCLTAISKQLVAAERNEKAIGMKQNTMRSYVKSFLSSDDLAIIDIFADINGDIKRLII